MLWLWLKSQAKGPAPLALLFCSTYVLSCSVGGAPVRVVKGQAFPSDKVTVVAEGISASQVVELLGEPLTITSDGDVTTWHYFYREQRDDVVRVLGILPFRRVLAIWEVECDVYLVENIVVRTQLFKRQIK